MLKRRPMTLAGLAVIFALAQGLTPLTLAGQQQPQQQSQQERSEQRQPQITPAPNRKADEGRGPFKTFMIRGAILIDGTGSPPYGPVNILIENNRIKSIQNVSAPGTSPRQDRQPQKPEFEIDATGMYVMPGFVDMHVHAGGAPKNRDAEYPYKLWLAHGVTTVRGVPLGSNEFSVKEKERSAKNEIVAPRIVNYQRPGTGWKEGQINTPEAARAWVRWAAQNGVDGMKLGSFRPEIMEALLSEAKKLGLGSTAHLGQVGVAQMNAIKAARLGLETVTHFYGHFEALMKDYVVQPWPVDQKQDSRAGQPRVGRVPQRASVARHGLRPDLQHILRRPRRYARPHRRMARQVHAPILDGIL
jgi:imidazolonepropionase-like amidohydrolase